VIGPALNLAARLEGLCRELGLDPMGSDAFGRLCAAAQYRLLGGYRLLGIGGPVEALMAFERA
jgi:class 3 adenylate cyclase